MDVTLEPCADFDILNAIVREESVYRACSDDFAPDAQAFDLTGAGMLFVLVRAGGMIAGFYALHFHSAIMAEIHTCILPRFRGDTAARAARKIIAWVFEQTQCLKLITLVPECNKVAAAYARRAGLVDEGLLTKSFLKGGVLHDQLLLAICKENAPCQS